MGKPFEPARRSDSPPPPQSSPLDAPVGPDPAVDELIHIHDIVNRRSEDPMIAAMVPGMSTLSRMPALPDMRPLARPLVVRAPRAQQLRAEVVANNAEIAGRSFREMHATLSAVVDAEMAGLLQSMATLRLEQPTGTGAQEEPPELPAPEANLEPAAHPSMWRQLSGDLATLRHAATTAEVCASQIFGPQPGPSPEEQADFAYEMRHAASGMRVAAADARSTAEGLESLARLAEEAAERGSAGT